MNAFLICLSPEPEDTFLNNVSLDCFSHIIHFFLSYTGTNEQVTFCFGGEQHSFAVVEPEVRFFILDSSSFSALLLSL